MAVIVDATQAYGVEVKDKQWIKKVVQLKVIDESSYNFPTQVTMYGIKSKDLPTISAVGTILKIS